MHACHILLGRPWQYDVDAMFKGHDNMYLFWWQRWKIVLVPSGDKNPLPNANYNEHNFFSHCRWRTIHGRFEGSLIDFDIGGQRQGGGTSCNHPGGNALVAGQIGGSHGSWITKCIASHAAIQHHIDLVPGANTTVWVPTSIRSYKTMWRTWFAKDYSGRAWVDA